MPERLTDADAPDTPALRALEDSGIEYRVVRTRPAGSAEESAQLQGILLNALLLVSTVAPTANVVLNSTASCSTGSQKGR